MNDYRIKELRLAKAWSQEQLAELSSLSTRTVQRIENGEQASLDTLAAIASAFGVSVTDLYSGDAAADEYQKAQALDERLAIVKRQVESEARFYRQTTGYILTGILLAAINWLTSHAITWSAIVIAVFTVLQINQGMRTFVIDRRIDRWKAKKTHKLMEK